jgi:putative DNA primase/helicase
LAYQIQVLGLREKILEGNKTKKTEAFHNRMWRSDSEELIFDDPNSILAQVPASEQYNLYWTIARCFPEKGRKLAEQFIIPWDIDHIGAESQEDGEAKAAAVAKIVCETLGVKYDETGVIFSGHGVQLFIKLVNPILSDDYFDAVREHYKFLCDKIQLALQNKATVGTVDTSVFSAGRLMRFPNTINRKPGKSDRFAKVIQPKLTPIVFDIMEKSGISELKKPEQIHPDTIKKYPKPDTKAVLTGCGFIQNCFVNQDKIQEPAWYAAMSVVALLEDGEKLVHEMSEKHPGYSEHETSLKITQALKNSGPRTCRDISTRWDGCKNCPHYGNLTSPILITGPDYIKTESTGYREIAFDANGVPKTGKVNYDDLIKRFGKDQPFVCIADMRSIFVFNGRFWERLEDLKIQEWMVKLVKPSAAGAEMDEFLRRLKAQNVRDLDWFTNTSARKMNFKNGVLDLDTMELVQHSPAFGFTFSLPYDYDSRAECPTWDAFIKDICSDDEKLVSLLEEFAGYAIAGGECLAEKALVLYGEGANGKSVYAETIEQVLGPQNTSNIMIHNLGKDQMISGLLHKPYNYSDETLDHAFKNPGEFKSLVTGGSTMGKIVYQATFKFKNRAKFVISTNKLPDTNDNSNGLYRRLLIAHFRKQYNGTTANKMLRQTLWGTELAGICNRFIEGYKRLMARGYNFDAPESVENMSKQFARENNSVLRFTEEFCTRTLNDEDRVTSAEAYKEYCSWVEFQNERPVTMRHFITEFKKALELGDSTTFRNNDKVVRGWKNIQFTKRGDF